MKKGTVTGWKRPLAAALGALFVLGAVCGMGGLPDGVRDALPEAVRETVTPVTAQAAGGDPAMTQEAGVLRTGANTDSAQTVYYANNPWRVIGYGATDGNAYARQDGMLTLFSADNLTSSQFNPYNDTKDCNDYGKNPENTSQQSMLKATVDSLFNGSGAPFSDKEQRAVVIRTLETGEYSDVWPYSNGVSGNQTSGYLWPLSALEADSMHQNLRKASDLWWLRSPGRTNLSAANVNNSLVAYAGGFRVDKDLGVRPAFHLNLKSVIFTSAAEGGKSSGAVGKGALKQVGQNSGNEWKLTLLDDGTVSGLDGHTGFSAQCVIGAPGTQSPTSATVEQGKQVTLSYSGAKTTTNEYVSAILKDNTGNILYYGNLAKTENKDANSPTGGVPLTIPSTVQPGTYILGVFAEQFNGDKKTDYASKVSNISLTVTAQTHTVTVTGTGHGTVSPPSQSGAQNDTVTLTATPDTGYRFVRWEVT